MDENPVDGCLALRSSSIELKTLSKGVEVEKGV